MSAHYTAMLARRTISRSAAAQVVLSDDDGLGGDATPRKR
jgi:hypothetical protein